MLKRGLLIAFVGIDGAGKTTHSKRILRYLTKYSTLVDIVKAYDKTDSSVLTKYRNEWDGLSLTLFFQILHRFQYKKTMDIISKKGIAIADKWNEAYFAYHNHFGLLAKKLSFRKDLDSMTFFNCKPDICFYIRISSQTVRKRLKQRKEKDISDMNAIKHTDLLISFYEKEAKKNKWVVLDGKTAYKITRNELFQ